MDGTLIQTIAPVYDWLIAIMIPWGLIALFILTFLESLYVIGLATPGEVTVVAATLVAAGSGTSIYVVFVVAWLGSVLGVVFGYVVGRKLGVERLRALMTIFSATKIGRLIKVDPDLVDDVCEYFEKHGTATSFIARFAYGMKSFIPPVAGASRMPFMPFIISTLLGGGIYTAVLVAIGQVLYSNANLANQLMKSLSWFAGGLLIALFVFGTIVISGFARRRKIRFLEARGIPYETIPIRLPMFWHDVAWFDEVSSTNDVAFDAAEKGTRPPAAYIARAQSAGRGRLGRSWSSQEGEGIYFSMMLATPEEHEGNLGSISLLAALAVLQVSQKLLYAHGQSQHVDGLTLKWPNDVFLYGKKLAGILAECRGDRLVIGVGINLKEPFGAAHSSFAPELATEEFASRRASFAQVGVAEDPKKLVNSILQTFETMYSVWQKSGFSPYLDRYERAEQNVGEIVEIYSVTGELLDTGFCVGFSDTGAMLLGDKPENEILPDGVEFDNIRAIYSGEVTLRKPQA